MAEDDINNETNDELGSSSEENTPENSDLNQEKVMSLSGMYQDWFLDYASYVILERAVPDLADGLKPVQRRILHSMKDLDDGRYNKVANIIGHTMKYHPHGDASIGDALVQVGQKDIAIDMQGNWGNLLTGDRAAAPRYIEARLSKFAAEVIFNHKTTKWQASYDGRNREPVHLPIKFPLLLAQGAEGIAVGLACKMLPHNFVELIDASIAVLKGKKTNILPDFHTGGMADFSNYNEGLRGGKVRVRARIRQEDVKTLVIEEIPFGTTTSSLIDSILKANDKGKIKIRKIEDNTAENVEILVHLPPGTSPDKSIDALYAFTDCETSISPNACVIENDRPNFLNVNEMLKHSTDRTVGLLKLELEIKKGELEEQWHFSSLEKIFIENKIYIDFDGKTYEEAIEVTHVLLKPHIKHLVREVTDEDVKKLLEIRMRRITKHDSEKADELLTRLEEELEVVKGHLNNLIEYAIDYFKNLKVKYAEGRERKTEIKTFDNIEATKVVVANKKLYVNREEGFVGWGLRKDEQIGECSDIDDIIVFREDATMQVVRNAEKKFVGKGIIFAAVWKKGDERTIYHLIYQDGKAGTAMMKRFAVKSITREKEYDLTKGNKGSKTLYFSANPNGEVEIVSVLLRPRPSIKKLKFELDFSKLGIKGRAAGGNMLTKHLVSKIVLKEKGGSTLSARKIWFDDIVQRLNADGRGEFLGKFKGEDKIVTVTQNGTYRLRTFDLAQRFEDDIVFIEKYDAEKPVSLIYLDAEKELFYVKRFVFEEVSKPTIIISESENSHVELITTVNKPVITIKFDQRSSSRDDEEVSLEDFIAVKGFKSQGNRLTPHKIKEIELTSFEEIPEPEEVIEEEEEESEGAIRNPDDDEPTQITLDLD